MKQTLYLETTIVSYLTALPSRDLVVAAHQRVTRDWWKTRSAFEMYVSQFVLDEPRRRNGDWLYLQISPSLT